MNIYMVGLDEIQEEDTTLIEVAVQEVCDAYLPGQELGSVTFGIICYDSDPRALFDIPEVRKWCAALYERVPHLFSVVDLMTFSWLFPCVADIEIVERTAKNTAFKFNEGTKKTIGDILVAGEALMRRLAPNDAARDSLVAQDQKRLMQGMLLHVGRKSL